MPDSRPACCVIGAGYTGRRVAAELLRRGHRVFASRRGSVADAAGDGIVWITMDLDADAEPELPAEPLSILYLVPPGAGETDPRLARLLNGLVVLPERIVLASTSGVYGDCGGALVGEDQPLRPTSDRARRRVVQEALLRQWAARNRVDWVILRISGIYGPGRLPLESLRDGIDVIAADEAWPGNRIHVDDLARIAAAALVSPLASGVYNVADGNYLSGTAFYRRVAELADLPPPTEISRERARREFSPLRYSFLADSRRLDVTRMHELLGDGLRYADLDDGIRASLRADESA